MFESPSIVGTLNRDPNAIARSGARRTLDQLTRLILALRAPDPVGVDPRLSACATRVAELLDKACDDIDTTLLSLYKEE